MKLSILYQYTKERFPILGVLFYVLFFILDAYYLNQIILNTDIKLISLPLILGFITLFLFFFHLRVFDEFKDYADDKLAHPDRLLSRGIITLSDLKKLGIVAVLIQFFISIYLGKIELISWIVIFLYSYLMYKEFFIHDILKKSIGLYLISHQLLVPLMVVYCFTLNTNQLHLNHFFAIFFISLLSLGYEIARKVWEPAREHAKADSYSKFWGIKNSIMVLSSIYIVTCIIQYKMNTLLINNSYYTILATILCVILNIVNLNFVITSNHKNSKLVEVGGALFLLLNHLLTIIFILLKGKLTWI
ncbi:MAG: hypothetical protein U0T83_04640 [Bacteriovoracaceae bacterium]